MNLAPIGKLLTREPVMLGVFATATFEAIDPAAASLTKVAVGAGVAWVVRLLSTPTAKVAEVTATAVAAKQDEIHAYLEGAGDK